MKKPDNPILPKVHPMVDIMLNCAVELIEKNDPDGFLAMYWLTKWVQRKPKFNSTSEEADEPTPYAFRRHFNNLGEFKMPFPHRAFSSNVIEKVYVMARSRIPRGSKIRKGLYDE